MLHLICYGLVLDTLRPVIVNKTGESSFSSARHIVSGIFFSRFSTGPADSCWWTKVVSSVNYEEWYFSGNEDLALVFN